MGSLRYAPSLIRSMRGKTRKRCYATGVAVWFQTILMTKNFVEDPVNGPRAAIVASGAVRNSSGPSTFVHTGNGIYEKTPRCPRGWSVHCWCFCTGTRSRPCHHHSCSRSHDGPGSSSGHQQGRQEKDPQKGRQEENRPQGRLKQHCKACCARRRAFRPSLIQNRPLLRAFSLVLQTPCAPPELFATAAVRPLRSCRPSCCLFARKPRP